MALETDNLLHDYNRDTCLQLGGILPEPRTPGENQFLNNMGTDTFLLGMNDRETEGTWVWNSDGTPVRWFNWYDPPSGGTIKNCAIMLRTLGNVGPEWLDLKCGYEYDFPISLICQKGMCFSVVSIFPSE